MSFLQKIGHKLAWYLSNPRTRSARAATCRPEILAQVIQPGDVLLVDGNSIFSQVIKYLTQSSWSHAALHIGNVLPAASSDAEPRVLIEADINYGVRAVGLSEYASFHTRICRPVGLSKAEIDQVIGYAVARFGHQYDLRNVIDLARYMLLQSPPVPIHWRRRLLALGSGNPTQAICSSLIARAFQSVQYPILPDIVFEAATDPMCYHCYREILHIRHHSLFTPRDFDVSPYFQIIKPTLETGFDPHAMMWAVQDSS